MMVYGQVSMTHLPSEKTQINDHMLMSIQPSEPVVLSSAFDKLKCAPGNFNSSIPSNYTVDVLLKYSRQCASISKFESIIGVLQVSTRVNCPSETTGNHVQVQGGRNKVWHVVGNRLLLRIDLNTSKQEDVSIQLERRKIVDLAGNANQDEVLSTFAYRPTIGRPATQRHLRLVRRVEPLVR